MLGNDASPAEGMQNIAPSKEFLACLPKAELHVHLEGSLQPDTLREIARDRSSVRESVEEWIAVQQRRRYRYATFVEFIEAFKFVAVLLDRPAIYALATTRLMESLAAQNVKYAEITLSAGVILWKNQPLDAVFEAVRAASLEAEARSGLRVNWIFDAVRQFGPEHALQVVDWACRYQSNGVVAFGLGGDEERGPAELFRAVYRKARDKGLHVIVHAGETGPPESVRQAVELLHAERIGHGLAAAQSPEVLALLRDRGTPLEVCPTSNVALGLVPEFNAHPLPMFMREGVTVTLNSDDPALFDTSLEREFTLAAQNFSLSRGQIVQLCRNAIQAAFLSAVDKRLLVEQVEQAAKLAAGEINHAAS